MRYQAGQRNFKVATGADNIFAVRFHRQTTSSTPSRSSPATTSSTTTGSGRCSHRPGRHRQGHVEARSRRLLRTRAHVQRRRPGAVAPRPRSGPTIDMQVALPDTVDTPPPSTLPVPTSIVERRHRLPDQHRPDLARAVPAGHRLHRPAARPGCRCPTTSSASSTVNASGCSPARSRSSARPPRRRSTPPEEVVTVTVSRTTRSPSGTTNRARSRSSPAPTAPSSSAPPAAVPSSGPTRARPDPSDPRLKVRKATPGPDRARKASRPGVPASRAPRRAHRGRSVPVGDSHIVDRPDGNLTRSPGRRADRSVGPGPTGATGHRTQGRSKAAGHQAPRDTAHRRATRATPANRAGRCSPRSGRTPRRRRRRRSSGQIRTNSRRSRRCGSPRSTPTG